jgi:hypothetical protein
MKNTHLGNCLHDVHCSFPRIYFASNSWRSNTSNTQIFSFSLLYNLQGQLLLRYRNWNPKSQFNKIQGWWLDPLNDWHTQHDHWWPDFLASVFLDAKTFTLIYKLLLLLSCLEGAKDAIVQTDWSPDFRAWVFLVQGMTLMHELFLLFSCFEGHKRGHCSLFIIWIREEVPWAMC